MIGLQVRFLAGRFHANGWYHAHNEGIPEWPPSPWRVLRALVSAAYAEDLSQMDVEPLLETLRCLPRYRLPPAVAAHTRHYMPDTDESDHRRTKVFDSFVAVAGGAVDPQPVTIAWPVALSPDGRRLLNRLCRRISYLGRSESWSEISVVEIEGDCWDCWPDEGNRQEPATTLLAPQTAEDLAAWSRDRPAPKKGRDVPRTLWDVLTFSGERYRQEGWSAVPGTRRVRYVFGREPFLRSAIASVNARSQERPLVARYALRSAVLPRLAEALSLGERLRVAAMSHSRRVSGDVRPVFSGHGEGPSNHQHAMYLSATEDPSNLSRGLIDHLVIVARGGFADEDVIALQGVRRIWGRGGHDLELVLVGLGKMEDQGGLKPPRTRLLATSRVWESLTPFVPTRHAKVVRGVTTDTIEDQIRRGCQQLIGVSPVAISPTGDPVSWSRFRRRRMHGQGRRGSDRAYGARLVFESPVTGPIALGYGAHYGLGVFIAMPDSFD